MRLKLYLIYIFIFFLSFFSFAQVTIVGGGSILGMCLNSSYSVPTFIIKEKNIGDFNLNTSGDLRKFSIAPPANFNFSPGVGTVIASPNGDITEPPQILVRSDSSFITFNTNSYIPDGNPNGTSIYVLANGFYNHERASILYTNTEINRSGFISGISFFINQHNNYYLNPAVIPVKIQIKIIPTTTSAFTSVDYSNDTLGATTVFNAFVSSNTQYPQSYTNFNFGTPFYYDGVSNLQIFIRTDIGSWISYEGSKIFRGHYTGASQYAYAQNDIINPQFLSLSSYRPNVLFNFTAGNNLNLDNFTISGLQVTSTAISSGTMNLVTGNFSLAAVIPKSITNLSSSYSIGKLSGMASTYCFDGGSDTISVFPTGGTYSIVGTNYAGMLNTTLASNKFAINPQSVTSSTPEAFSLIYNYPDLANNGCTFLSTDFTVYPKLPQVDFIGLSNAYPINQANSVIPLLVERVRNVSGYFSGLGVSADSFYVDLAGLGPKTISYNYANDITGCSNSVSYDTYVYDENSTLVFNPLPVLGQGKFCIDDVTQYRMSLFTIPGAILTPEQQIDGFCSSSLSISSQPRGQPYVNTFLGQGFGSGISFLTTITSISQERLNPSGFSPGDYTLYYNNDALETANSSCLGTRLSNSGKMQNWLGKKQDITIYDLPQAPQLPNSEYAFCQGAVANDLIQVLNPSSVPGSYFQWYLVVSSTTSTPILGATLSGVNVNTLGINNATSIVGIPFKFGVKQNVNGCWGPVGYFQIRIKEVPTAPGIVFVSGSANNCQQDQPDIQLTTQQSTISGVSVSWYFNPQGTVLASINTIFKPNITFDIADTISFYAIQELEGCRSNLVNTSIGLNVAKADILISPLPTWGLPNNPFTDKYCAGNSTIINDAFVTVNGLNVSTVNGAGFNWYKDLKLSNLIGTGITTVLGNNIIGNFFNTSLSGSIITDTTIYAGLKSDAGCLSTDAKKYTIKVINVPSKPVVDNTQNDMLTGGEICFNTISFTGLTIAKVTGVFYYYSWYYDSGLTNLILTTTSTNFVTSILGNTTVNTNFYLVQNNDICPSEYKKVNITIKPQLPKPIINPLNYYCTLRTIPALSATGVNGSIINWYSSKAQKIVSANPYDQPISNTTVNTYFYAYQSFDNCISDTSTVLLRVLSTPNAPISLDTAYCSGSAVQSLKIKALNQNSGFFRWFDSGGSDTLNTFKGQGTTSIVGSSLMGSLPSTISGIATTITGNLKYNYYASYFKNGCASDLVKISVGVFVVPDKPVSYSPDTICTNIPLATLGAKGDNIRWYYSSTSTSSIINGDNFSPQNFGYVNTVQWVGALSPPLEQYVYVTQTTNINTPVGNYIFKSGCESAFKVDTIMVKALPPQPVITSPFPYCSGDVLNVITTTSVDAKAIITWYSNEVDPNNQVAVGTSFSPSKVITSSETDIPVIKTFKVTQEFNNCKYPDITATNVTITINALPKPLFIVNPKKQYCYYEGLIDLKVNLTSTGIISGFSAFAGNNYEGIYAISTTIPGVFSGYTTSGIGIVLNPSNVQIASDVNLAYIYTDENGCVNTVQSNFIINPKPTISFTGLNAQYCNEPGSYNLNLLPPDVRGQVVKGAGINSGGSGYIFQPSVAGDNPVPYEITYTYIDQSTFCVDSTKRFTTVYPLPKVDFSISSQCLGDDVVFTDLSTTPSPLSISSNQWTFNDTEIKSGVSTTYTYPGIGNFQMSLKVTSNVNCSNYKDSTYTVGPKPVAGFNWVGICEGSPTQFKSTSVVDAGDIVNLAWLVENIISSSSATNLQHTFGNSGSKITVLTVTTDRNCFDTTSRIVNILPSYILTETPIFENFNQSNGGWFTEGRNSDWIYGIPNKVNLKSPDNSGGWYTGLNTQNYQRNQSSWVNSPCFDFTNVTKPMMVLDFASYIYKDDGVVVQVTTNSGVSWNNLGEINSGINWYNRSNIFGNPGEQKVFKNGWSIFDDSSEWTQARHSLDKYIGAKNVRLRVALGSTADSIPSNNTLANDGFGFDNVWVGERTKRTLVEQFINTSNDISVISNVNYIINSRQTDVVAIQYHTSFPEDDKFNLKNPADPSARVLYYGIQSAPRTVFDGNVFNALSSAVNTQAMDLRALKSPKFSISVNQTVAGGNLVVSGKVISDTLFGDSSVVLQVAVIERKIKDEIFESVLRKMLPDAAGTLIKKNWIVGTDTTFYHTWAIEGVDSIPQLETVVFIQNQKSREVYQVGYTGGSISYTKPINTSTDNTSTEAAFKLYPNPAFDLVNLELGLGIGSGNFKVAMLDMYGNVVFNQTMNVKNGRQMAIDLSNFPSGLYNLSLNIDGTIYNRKLTIIH